MILTTAPQALPGSCVQCGSASRDSYIDTGRSEEFHGAVYYCNICVAEMAALLGFLPPEKVQWLELKIEILEQNLFEAQRRCAGLERALDGVRFAGIDVPESPQPPVGVDSVESSTELPSDDDADSDEAVRIGASNVGRGEGETLESLHDEGVGVVHSDVSSDGDSEFKLEL